ncbi:hypothetical protein KKC45_01975 [Patescibacteria group bacterium]|nr:hypothetical protein [Patescibacteria group bacterium]
MEINKLMNQYNKTLILIALFFIFLPNSVFACSCVADIPQEESFNQAKAVFIGRVISINKKGEFLRLKNSHRNINFNVTEYWKGEVSKITTVATGFGGGDCGYYFAEGETYLVYANDGNSWYGEDLATSICSRTERLRDVSKDLALLGAGTIIPHQKQKISLKELTIELVQLATYPIRHSLLIKGSLGTAFITLFFYYVGPLVLILYFLYKKFKK